MKRIAAMGSFAALALFSMSIANATPYIVNVPLSDIGTSFDDVIAATGSSVSTAQVVWGQNAYDFTDSKGNVVTVSVTRPNGASPVFAYGHPDMYKKPGSDTSPWPWYAPDFNPNDFNYKSNGVSLSGASWGINPKSNSNDSIPGFNSGLTFTFSSPVNAFGFEVGDWSTCCQTRTRPDDIVNAYGVPATGTGLWIAFDGGAATLPANALVREDNPGYAAAESHTNFIGAIDSSGYFSSVTFFGDGFGEILTAGGTLRFAAVPLGSVNEGGAVPGIPEPETWAMLLAGLGIVGATTRKRHTKAATA
jgi:hypothetical protein